MIKNRAYLLMMAAALLFTVAACGSESTRVNPRDDEEDPIKSSSPYSSDVFDVADAIISQLRKKHVLEDFRARYDDAPIVAVIRPQNDTRFPEVTTVFQEHLVHELMDKMDRSQVRFSQRDSDVQKSISEEKTAKESGERTDRTGRRTKLGADYFLKAKFSGLSMTDGHDESDTIFYKFQLIDTETDELIFDGEMAIKRVAEKHALYR